MKNVFGFIFRINWLKTLIFNFYYFPFGTAVRLPAFVYRHTCFYVLKGRIEVDAPVKTGMLKIGPYGLGNQDASTTVWNVRGLLVLKGGALVGRGSKINIGRLATLELGDHFTISSKSEIICRKRVVFGSDCLLSWDILVMDSDLHDIRNERGETINAPRPVEIGNHVWIGCRSMILKGVTVKDGCIVAAGSTLTKSYESANCILGGGKIEAIKTNIEWKR